MQIKYEYKKLLGLSESESLILSLIINEFNKLEHKKDEIIKMVTSNNIKIDQLRELGIEINLIQDWKGTIESLKILLWDTFSAENLTKIDSELPFIVDSRWSTDPYLIPKIFLRKFDSYTKIDSSDSKAHIAKKLGATITA